MTDLVCYMNEYGLVTEREETAKLWTEAGTQVWVMEPGYEYAANEPRPLSEVLTVHREDTTQFPYAPHPDVVGKGYAMSGWAVAGGEAVNPMDDADCAPDPNGVSFTFNSGDYSDAGQD